MKQSKRVKAILFLSIFLIFFLSGTSDSSDNPTASGPEYAPDEFIVKFKSTVEQDMATAIADDNVSKPSLAGLNKKYKVRKTSPYI